VTTKVIHVRDMASYLDAVYIGRAMPRRRLKASPFQNPFRVDTLGRQGAIQAFRNCLMDSPGLLSELPDLRDRALACWCRRDGEERTPDNECHGDVLIDLLSTYTDDELRAMAQESEVV
jgi:hypothetical protein